MVTPMKKLFRMRAAQISIARTLKQNLRRFLSIFMIVALGSGFMAGLQAASPDMYDTADRYFDEQDWYDLDIKCPFGFTPADVEMIRQQDFASLVQPARTADTVLTGDDGSEHTSRVFAILDASGGAVMNRPRLVSGRFPENSGECVIQTALSGYDEHPVGIGSVLAPPEGSEGFTGSFTVVGTVESPMCISLVAESTTAGNGSIALNVFVPEDALGSGRVTDVYVGVAGAKELNTFSSAYDLLISEAAEKAKGMVPAGAAALERAREEGMVLNARAASAAGEHSPALQALLLDVGNSPVPPERESGSFPVFTRADGAGYDIYRSNVGKVAALADIFPAFFFLVALLVALTAMTRLVDEKRTEIGLKKALGVSDGRILAEYLFYALAVSVPGCLFGLAAGFRIFPLAISGAYGMMFFLPPTLTPFRIGIAAWVAPVTVGSIVAAAVLACAGESASLPAPLLRPRAPAPGKRVLPESFPRLWRRLSFWHKVIVRNLFRYRKRFFMTVCGIMGCSALLLTGFGLRDSVNDIIAVQFSEIDHYHMTVLTDSPGAAQADERLGAILGDKDRVAAYGAFSISSGKAENGTKTASVTLTIAEDTSSFGRFITLRERESRRSIPLEEGSGNDYPVVMTEKTAGSLGLKRGSRFILENASGLRAEVTLSGIAENYLESGVYMTRDTYAAAFGQTPDFSVILCASAEGADTDRLSADLMNCPHVFYASSITRLQDNFAQAIRGMDGVVVVLILSAGLLCMVVLYNLISINICERRKELATLAVLGCHDAETRRIIFRETDILSLIGALAGILPGRWLHAYVVSTVEIDQIMFGRAIHPAGYFLSMAITMVFTVLYSLLMRRQLRSIDMVEAMKAGE